MSVSTATSDALTAVGDEKVDIDQLQLHVAREPTGASLDVIEPVRYRLYKARWSGLVSLFLLNIAAGMSWPYFGPIANPVAARYHFTLDGVNWLGNSVALVFLPTSFVIPYLCQRWGLRRVCLSASVCVLFGSWLRFAGTAKSLTPAGAYLLMIIGQILVGIAQPIFQVIGPKYSELWFDLKFRTTATMIIAIANPLGGALGQLLSPIPTNTTTSIFILGVVGTAIAPLALFIQDRPPTPPTHAASTPSPSMLSTFRAVTGKTRPGDEIMDIRERIDFVVLLFVFGQCVAAVQSFSLLTNEIFEPYGYSETFAGLTGAALLLSGIVAAIISAPILDRHLTRHMGLLCRCLLPVLGVGWIAFIFAVRSQDTAGIFICVVFIGVASLILLPVGLEIGCEVTRNPETSSAMLWLCGNALSLIYVPIETALKAPANATPPNNLHRGLIFQGVMVGFAAVAIFALRGKQTRRELDLDKAREAAAVHELSTRPIP